MPTAELTVETQDDWLRIKFPQDMDQNFPGLPPQMLITANWIPRFFTAAAWEDARTYTYWYEYSQDWTPPVMVQQVENGVRWKTLDGDTYPLIPPTEVTLF